MRTLAARTAAVWPPGRKLGHPVTRRSPPADDRHTTAVRIQALWEQAGFTDTDAGRDAGTTRGG